MDTNETPVVPEPTPTHEAGPWNIHRQTLITYAHEVGGIRFIGGAGQRLDEVLRATWVNEAHQLADDLCIAFRYLPETAIRAAVSQIGQAADMTMAMRGSIVETARAREDDTPSDGEEVAGAGRRARVRRDAARALDEARDSHDEGAVA